ncbi:hypothetical protein AcW1_008844 [Taiwanofungus camphoratus]|nr:hypothetical protein AcW1_008844 [Antrodia cinnamomea]
MGTNLTQGKQTRIILQTLAGLVRFSAQQPVVSFDRNKPLPITREYLNILLHRLDFTASAIVGVGQVIRGWDEGLQGMCLNEKRTLTIPSHLAYGPRGFGSVIPPNSALIFDVELVSLESKGPREEL